MKYLLPYEGPLQFCIQLYTEQLWQHNPEIVPIKSLVPAQDSRKSAIKHVCTILAGSHASVWRVNPASVVAQLRTSMPVEFNQRCRSWFCDASKGSIEPSKCTGAAAALCGRRDKFSPCLAVTWQQPHLCTGFTAGMSAGLLRYFSELLCECITKILSESAYRLVYYELENTIRDQISRTLTCEIPGHVICQILSNAKGQISNTLLKYIGCQMPIPNIWHSNIQRISIKYLTLTFSGDNSAGGEAVGFTQFSSCRQTINHRLAGEYNGEGHGSVFQHIYCLHKASGLFSVLGWWTGNTSA